MSSTFERMAKSSRSIVETIHGVDVTVYPLVRPDVNGPQKLSPTDAPYDTSALFYSDTLEKVQRDVQPQTGTGQLLHRSLMLQASIRLVAGKPLQTNFILQRKADGALFSITRFDADGVGNVMATLGVAKSLPES